ncbi:polysaccharide deacetylase family protein [Actinoplanes sp. NPDC051851]|uniref:polysaccharide deacetylase family protein n=1 Tax=Actinoplanes sp. NPDC051851 TaxID=3154753 RepID=UPI003424A95D
MYSPTGEQTLLIPRQGRATQARHRAGATESYSFDRNVPPRRTRRYRNERAGAHRAPGTLTLSNLPIGALLSAARNRPQAAVLSTLVVAGLMLSIVPFSQQGDDPSVVNTAAQAAAAQAEKKKTADKAAGGASNTEAEPTAEATASPTPEATTTQPAGYDPELSVLPVGNGPASSLLTSGTQAVSLTFDDGPDPQLTPKLLKMLDEYQVKATFCLVGTQVKKHPELVRDIVAAGHTLCNHTWNHDLTIGKKSAAKIRADLEKTNAAIQAAVPGAQIRFFRAPGGNFTDKLVKVAHAEGMASLYWEVDPRDWEHTEDETDAEHTARVIATVKKQVKPGAIILSHDFNQPDTIAAYEKLIPWLAERYSLGVPTGEGETPEAPASTAPTTEPTPSPSVSTSPTPSESSSDSGESDSAETAATSS